MTKCAFKSCKNHCSVTLKKDGITYHRFPKDYILREKWRRLVALDRNNEYFKPLDRSVVCSGHFDESDMYLTKKGTRRVKPGAIPHIIIKTQSPAPAGEDPLQSFPTITVCPGTVKLEDTRSGSPLSDGLISDTDSIFDTPFVSSLKDQLEAERRKSQVDKERLNIYRSQIRILRKRLKYYKNRTAKLKTVVSTMNNRMGTYKTVINKLTETIKNAKQE